MKIEKNEGAAFVNAVAMDEEECLGTVVDDSSSTVENMEDKQKQTFLIEDGSHISSVQSDRWRKLSRQIRGAIAIKNAAVKPNRRKSGRKSTTNIDPFLQKFSTREIGQTTQVPDASLRSIEEETDGVSPDENSSQSTNANHASGFYLFRVFFALRDFSPTGVIDPDGAFLYYWLYFLITAVRYNLWVVILRFAFVESQENHPTLWWAFDSIADLIYILDIFVNCRVGYYEEGILVRDPKLAYKRYLLTWRFILDIISILPLELLYFQTGTEPILRFPRLLKTYKSQEIKAKVEGRANHPTIVRVFFLVHLMFLLLHWNAGIYFLISRAEGFGTNSWGYPELNGSYNTLTRKYVHSFYWSALTLTTIGDLPPPETNVEYFYTIACYLSGVFVFAMIVGNAGSIILDRNASRMDFEKQRDNAKNYMKTHNVPRDLHRRVVKWYDYSWSRGRMSGGSGDLNSLHLLPDKMKTEIALHVHLETLRKVTFLQNCEPEFLHELLLKMRLHIFTPGDLIIRHGEIAREMYLIAHGRIEVISETGKVLKELGSGEFFGEIGILSLSEGQNRRTADVRSIGYTECFVLSKDDVLGEIHQFPRAQKILAEYGRKRLQNTSGDPRLVKLDGQNSPVAKTRWQAARPHVVNMLNETQSPSNEGDRNLSGLLKNVTRDVVIPSLNSPGNILNDSSEKKAVSNSCANDGQNLNSDDESRSRDAQTSYPRVHSTEARDHSIESRDNLNEIFKNSYELPNQPNKAIEQLNKTCDYPNESSEHSIKSSGKSSCEAYHNDALESHAIIKRETPCASTADTSTCERTAVNMNKTENNYPRKAEGKSQMRGSTRVSCTRDLTTRNPRDIETCLNTLDYLKAVLQSTMHDTERQIECMTKLERQLEEEKERVYKAEQKIKLQENEIQRLLEINQALNAQVKQKDSEISDMENVLQLKPECQTENKLSTNENKKDREKRKMGNVSVELSQDFAQPVVENVLPKETILNISDTQC